MKNLLFIFLFCLISITLKGQEYQEYVDTIITIENDIISCKILSVSKTTVKFNFLKLEVKQYGYVKLSDVLSYKLDNKWTIRPVLDDHLINTENDHFINDKNDTWKKELVSGDYLIKAQNNMLIGILITTLGGLIGYTIPESSYTVGIVSGILGTAFNIVGIVYIGKSGEIHNKEKGMSLKLTPTNNGLGLCLNL